MEKCKRNGGRKALSVCFAEVRTRSAELRCLASLSFVAFASETCKRNSPQLVARPLLQLPNGY